MIQVRINKDTDLIKQKMFLGLTAKQLLFCFIGIVVALIVGLLLFDKVPVELLVVIIIPIVMTFALLGWTEKWFTFSAGELINTLVNYTLQKKQLTPSGEIYKTQKIRKRKEKENVSEKNDD